MTPSSNDIPIIESRNLDDNTSTSDKSVPAETEGASKRALEKQGIFLQNKKERPDRIQPRDEVSRELEDLGGIEIIPDSHTD